MNKTFSSLLAASILGVSASFVAVSPALAETPEIYTTAFSQKAVGGYDPVAYFTQGAPVKGERDFSYDYKGALWLFSSAENRDVFIADPDAYAPQYGGYCAWALAQNKLAKGDPKYWNIVDGRLYLNYNAKVQRDWLEDIPGFIEKADRFWPGILGDMAS
jgi:YHS domain-containing protein